MIPKPGDIYEFIVPVEAGSGKEYEMGDRLELIKPTGLKPHDRESKICNWVVKCKYFSPPAPESVWASIWNMIEFEYIRKVEQQIMPRTSTCEGCNLELRLSDLTCVRTDAAGNDCDMCRVDGDDCELYCEECIDEDRDKPVPRTSDRTRQ